MLGAAFLVHDLGLGLAAWPEGPAELKRDARRRDVVVVHYRRSLNRREALRTVDHELHETDALLSDLKRRTFRANPFASCSRTLLTPYGLGARFREERTAAGGPYGADDADPLQWSSYSMAATPGPSKNVISRAPLSIDQPDRSHGPPLVWGSLPSELPLVVHYAVDNG